MFDPIREFNRGDAYDSLFRLLMDIISLAAEHPGLGERLPHHVAMCVTKFDEPRVFKTAESLRMLVWDEHDPLGFPLLRGAAPVGGGHAPRGPPEATAPPATAAVGIQ
jgi:hypothetical protein